MLILKRSLCFGLVLFLLSCSIEKSLDPVSSMESPSEYTFTYIQENVFDKRCAFSGCHATDTKRAGLDLSSGQAYNSLVNKASVLSADGVFRVKPSESSSSFLISLLDGSNATKMPLNRAPLDAATVEYIRQWIDAGR